MLVFKTMKIDENQKIQFSDVNIKLQKISENLSFGKNRLSFSQFCLSFGQILSFGIAQFWDKCRKNKPELHWVPQCLAGPFYGDFRKVTMTSLGRIRTGLRRSDVIVTFKKVTVKL